MNPSDHAPIAGVPAFSQTGEWSARYAAEEVFFRLRIQWKNAPIAMEKGFGRDNTFPVPPAAEKGLSNATWRIMKNSPVIHSKSLKLLFT
jgi:hypothetical protein